MDSRVYNLRILYLLISNVSLDPLDTFEYHALIVHLGKMVCTKIPKCDICPLKGIEHRVKKDGKRVRMLRPH